MIRQLMSNILQTNTNGFVGANDPALQDFLLLLESLPKPPVVAALREYWLFPPSQFYDQGKLVALIQRHLAIDAGYEMADDAWTRIQLEKRRFGSRTTPELPQLIQKVIDYFGGWARCVDNLQERDFLRVYQSELDKITKGRILHGNTGLD